MENNKQKLLSEEIPKHPGIYLLEVFLKPNKLSQTDLQKLLHAEWASINNLINGKTDIELSMAIKLSCLFTETTPEYWLYLQVKYDIYRLNNTPEELLLKTERKLLEDLKKIQPFIKKEKVTYEN